MGSDKIEAAKRKGQSPSTTKGSKERGCFIGLNPTDERKQQAHELKLKPGHIGQSLSAALNSGLVISLRDDERSGAHLVTLTRRADDYRDNQTVGAYHTDPLLALCLALVYWEREYDAIADWRTQTRQRALDW